MDILYKYKPIITTHCVERRINAMNQNPQHGGARHSEAHVGSFSGSSNLLP
jgi:hypothetical protein